STPCFIPRSSPTHHLHSFPTRRSSDLPLPGVSIMGNNQPLASTDNNGQFTVSVAGGTELKFQFIGMQSQTITITQNTESLNISLERATNDLEDVVVIGYGERERKNLDRKSTRLNSSHVKISYAVFCLKKKIINIAN